jgi:hypothetical protein
LLVTAFFEKAYMVTSNLLFFFFILLPFEKGKKKPFLRVEPEERLDHASRGAGVEKIEKGCYTGLSLRVIS